MKGRGVRRSGCAACSLVPGRWRIFARGKFGVVSKKRSGDKAEEHWGKGSPARFVARGAEPMSGIRVGQER